MIKSKIMLCGPNAKELAKAIEPDNLPNMSLKIEGNCLCLEFAVERIGTLLSTIDDLLMNIKVAEETLVSAED
ncbi:MAG: KEOPS complex subunit Pcc1 [Methanotrichaceae archaeon]